MWSFIKSGTADLLSLFFPQLCVACAREAPPSGELLCLSCQYKLPRTDFHRHAENAFTERFWGRLRLESGAALYHFSKGGRVQQIIHRLKYQNCPDLGRCLGRVYGRELQESPFFRELELILPVPLHPKRQQWRGYNQSAVFAAGLSESMHIPWRDDVLVRRVFTKTQTHKSRMERLENVLKAFELKKPELVKGKRVLLVDDVLTTGATLEACGLVLLACPGIKLSMATIAIAEG